MSAFFFRLFFRRDLHWRALIQLGTGENFLRRRFRRFLLILLDALSDFLIQGTNLLVKHIDEGKMLDQKKAMMLFLMW